MSQDASTAEEEGSRANIRVWIDFVCPYCLLGEGVIRAATEGLAVDVVWMPFELRPYPTPTLRPEDEYLPTAWKQGVYPAAERMGIAIRLPTISPQPYTRKAFLGLQYAVEHGQGDAYVDAVLRAFFQQDRDIGDTDVLKAIIQDLGLDPSGLDAVLVSPLYGGATMRRCAGTRGGIRAVPSVLSGTGYSQARRSLKHCGPRSYVKRLSPITRPKRTDEKSTLSGEPLAAECPAAYGSHISDRNPSTNAAGMCSNRACPVRGHEAHVTAGTGQSGLCSGSRRLEKLGWTPIKPASTRRAAP